MSPDEQVAIEKAFENRGNCYQPVDGPFFQEFRAGWKAHAEWLDRKVPSRLVIPTMALPDQR